MAYVAGETLSQRVASHGRSIPTRQALAVRHWGGTGLCALARVVHRDVKPDNILLDAATERALLSDFGIAHETRIPGGRGARTSCRTARGSGRHRGIHESRASKRRRRRWAQRHLLAGCVATRPLGTAAFFATTDEGLLALHNRGSGAAARHRRSVRGATRRAIGRPCLSKEPWPASPTSALSGRRGGNWGLDPCGLCASSCAALTWKHRVMHAVRDGVGPRRRPLRLALANRGYGARSRDPGARRGNRGAGCGSRSYACAACSLPGITARISSRLWRSVRPGGARSWPSSMVPIPPASSAPLGGSRAWRCWWRSRVWRALPGSSMSRTPRAAAFRPITIGGAATALLAGVVARARTEQRTDPLGERSLSVCGRMAVPGYGAIEPITSVATHAPGSSSRVRQPLGDPRLR